LELKLLELLMNTLSIMLNAILVLLSSSVTRLTMTLNTRLKELKLICLINIRTLLTLSLITKELDKKSGTKLRVKSTMYSVALELLVP